MAVINTVDDVLSHPLSAGEYSGMKLMRVRKSIAIAADDSDGSSFLIAELPDSAIVDRISLEGATITAGSDYDIGLYDKDGVVIDKDCFADGLDLSSSTGLPLGDYGLPRWNGLVTLGVAGANKELYLHAGHVNKALPGSGETNRKAKYRIALTANTIGSAAGTLIATVDFRVPLG